MNPEKKTEETDKAEQPMGETEKNVSDGAGGEFKVTVRKLELPVRPRGVLAE